MDYWIVVDEVRRAIEAAEADAAYLENLCGACLSCGGDTFADEPLCMTCERQILLLEGGQA